MFVSKPHFRELHCEEGVSGAHVRQNKFPTPGSRERGRYGISMRNFVPVHTNFGLIFSERIILSDKNTSKMKLVFQFVGIKTAPAFCFANFMKLC
jgi:hypothetical protein